MRSLFIRASVILAALALLTVGWHPAQDLGTPAARPGSFTLHAPSFLSVARAEGQNASPQAGLAAFFDSQAGIAAYFKVNAIELSKVRATLRIDEEKPTYLIGSVRLDPVYLTAEEPKAYISSDGWALVYYPKDEPTAKIFDYKEYDKSYATDTNVPSKLDRALIIIATAAGVTNGPITYYHFQYPNAKELKLVAHAVAACVSAESFQITLPSGFDYGEQSWSLGSMDSSNFRGQLALNGELLAEHAGLTLQKYNTIDRTKMVVDKVHTFTLNSGCYGYGYNQPSYTAVAIVYTVK